MPLPVASHFVPKNGLNFGLMSDAHVIGGAKVYNSHQAFLDDNVDKSKLKPYQWVTIGNKVYVLDKNLVSLIPIFAIHSDGTVSFLGTGGGSGASSVWDFQGEFSLHTLYEPRSLVLSSDADGNKRIYASKATFTSTMPPHEDSNHWVDLGVAVHTLKGEKGDAGATGLRGERGEKGERGEVGARGRDAPLPVWRGEWSAGSIASYLDFWSYVIDEQRYLCVCVTSQTQSAPSLSSTHWHCFAVSLNGDTVDYREQYNALTLTLAQLQQVRVI